ncbi:MAG: hypothetical protein LBS77_04175 [Desulfovibrio sp.]|nr:hypothetical protein [Desulfovibrio sp.]
MATRSAIRLRAYPNLVHNIIGIAPLSAGTALAVPPSSKGFLHFMDDLLSGFFRTVNIMSLLLIITASINGMESHPQGPRRFLMTIKTQGYVCVAQGMEKKADEPASRLEDSGGMRMR